MFPQQVMKEKGFGIPACGLLRTRLSHYFITQASVVQVGLHEEDAHELTGKLGYPCFVFIDEERERENIFHNRPKV